MTFAPEKQLFFEAATRTRAHLIGCKEGALPRETQQEIKRLEERRHTTETTTMKDIITPEKAAPLINEVVTKLDTLSHQQPQPDIPNEEALGRMMRSWFTSWRALTITPRRDILLSTIDSIRVSPTYHTDGLVVVSPYLDSPIRVGGRLGEHSIRR